MNPLFMVTAYTGEDQTGEANGNMLEITTPQGTVVVEAGENGKTVVRFSGIDSAYRAAADEVVLGV